MTDALVSIIIPFYNEEKYLQRAVLSALRQSYHAVEIILVNDGSTDKSVHIAFKLAGDNANIKLINAAHCGPGDARNKGMDVASGKYVAFLDSDDELELNALERMVANIERHKTDMVVCKYGYYNSSGILARTGGWNLDGKPKNGQYCAGCMYDYTIANTAWAKLYRTNIACQSAFVSDSWFEDRPFVLRCFLNAGRVSFETEALWKIHARASSLTRRMITAKRIQDSCRIFLEELQLILTSGNSEILKSKFFRYHVDELMSNLLILCSDKKQVQNLSKLQTCFENWLHQFLENRKAAQPALGLKTFLNLCILNAYKVLGWRMTFFLLPVLKFRKYRYIQRLRNC